MRLGEGREGGVRSAEEDGAAAFMQRESGRTRGQLAGK
jgi:hypothetical protein